MAEETENPTTLVLQIICKAGQPLSRLEIARAMEPYIIPDLRVVIEEMLRAGLLTSYMSSTEHQTVVMRYSVGKNVDCSRL